MFTNNVICVYIHIYLYICIQIYTNTYKQNYLRIDIKEFI